MALTAKIIGPSGEREVKITSFPCTFGRSSTCDVILRDPAVSKKHFRIYREGGRFFVEDLGSSNGTLIHGKRITQVPLQDGTRIRAGKTEIIVSYRKTTTTHRDGEITRLFSSFFQVAKLLLVNIEEKYVFKAVLEDMLTLFNIDRIALYLDQEGIFQKVAEQSIDATLVHGCEPPVELIKEEASRGEGIQWLDSEQLPFDVVSACVVPVSESLDVLGAFYMDTFSAPLRLDEREGFLLTGIAGLLGVHLKARHLENKLEEERMFRDSLSRFVPPDALETIIGDREKLMQLTNRLERQNVTSMFVDIVSFSSMSERLSSEETAFVVNEFMSRVTSCVFNHGGSVNKYIGDAVFALFGTPIPRGDEEKRAIACAQEIIHQMDLIRVPGLQETLQVRIGINTGPCVVGFIGPAQRLEYTAIGDAVNVAARLQTLAKPNQILVGEATYRMAGEAFKFKLVGQLKLKGKTEPVGVYAVIG